MGEWWRRRDSESSVGGVSNLESEVRVGVAYCCEGKFGEDCGGRFDVVGRCACVLEVEDDVGGVGEVGGNFVGR